MPVLFTARHPLMSEMRVRVWLYRRARSSLSAAPLILQSTWCWRRARHSFSSPLWLGALNHKAFRGFPIYLTELPFSVYVCIWIERFFHPAAIRCLFAVTKESGNQSCFSKLNHSICVAETRKGLGKSLVKTMPEPGGNYWYPPVLSVIWHAITMLGGKFKLRHRWVINNGPVKRREGRFRQNGYKFRMYVRHCALNKLRYKLMLVVHLLPI